MSMHLQHNCLFKHKSENFSVLYFKNLFDKPNPVAISKLSTGYYFNLSYHKYFYFEVLFLQEDYLTKACVLVAYIYF